MRGAELFNADVLDPAGHRVGVVVDIRTVPEPRRLVVDGLILSRRHVQLFGYERSGEVGPALFSRLAAWLHRDTRYAPLDAVDLSTPRTVRLRMPWDELEPLADTRRRSGLTPRGPGTSQRTPPDARGTGGEP